MVRCLPPAAIASGRSDPGREGLPPSRELCLARHTNTLRTSRSYSALVWGFLSQAVFRWSASFLLVPCFCWAVSRFDRGTVSPSRPRLQVAPRAAVVKAGRRPPPEAARSGLDGGEHGAMLFWSGGAIGVIATGRIRGELACRLRALKRSAATLYSVRPFFGSGTMMQSCASTAKLRRAGPFYKSGTKAMGGSGTPPPRIVIGSVSPESGRAPKLGCYLLLASMVLVSRLELSRRAEPDEASSPPAPCRW
jgi:hypothetical protein